MMTNTTIRNHVMKQPHNLNNRNYATFTSCSSNLFLMSSNPPNNMTLVHNKSAVFPPLSCLKNHHFNCEINTDNVSNNADGDDEDDDVFTAELDLSEMYAFTRRRVLRVFTYGVGSEFKRALLNESGMDDIIGMDLIAMNFNHVVTCGAQPIMYSNFLACSTKVMRGMSRAVQQYSKQFDMHFILEDNQALEISGNVSSIGLASTESPIIDGKNIKAGDVLIGLPSSGIHSHGFSLVKRVIEQSGFSLQDNLPGTDITLGESLMTPTAMYVKQVLDIISQSEGGVKGIAYIARGGFTENIPRLFQEGLGAVVVRDSWPIPPIFKWIQEAGKIEDVDMRRTFNMEIGMVLVMSKESARKILQKSRGKNVVYRIGKVVSGDGVKYRKKKPRAKGCDIVKIYLTCLGMLMPRNAMNGTM